MFQAGCPLSLSEQHDLFIVPWNGQYGLSITLDDPLSLQYGLGIALDDPLISEL